MRFSSLIPITLFLLLVSSCGLNDTSSCNPPNEPTFSLNDLNPASETYGGDIGPQFFNGKVTLYYFPYSET